MLSKILSVDVRYPRSVALLTFPLAVAVVGQPAGVQTYTFSMRWITAERL